MDTDDWEEFMDKQENTLKDSLHLLMEYKSGIEIPENIYATLNRICSWAEERNLIAGATPKDQLAKLIQELGEVSDAICKNDRKAIQLEIGDMLVVLTIMCKMHELTIPECAEAAYNKIKDRRGVMFDGVFIKETDEEYETILEKLGR